MIMANEPMYEGTEQISIEYLSASRTAPDCLCGLPPFKPSTPQELVLSPSTDEDTGSEG